MLLAVKQVQLWELLLGVALHGEESKCASNLHLLISAYGNKRKCCAGFAATICGVACA